MGKPLTIKESDDEKLLTLKEQTGAKSKVEVLRIALNLLELDIAKKDRIKRWKKSARIVGDSGLEVLNDFNSNPDRLKGLPE